MIMPPIVSLKKIRHTELAHCLAQGTGLTSHHVYLSILVPFVSVLHAVLVRKALSDSCGVSLIIDRVGAAEFE